MSRTESTAFSDGVGGEAVLRCEVRPERSLCQPRFASLHACTQSLFCSAWGIVWYQVNNFGRSTRFDSVGEPYLWWSGVVWLGGPFPVFITPKRALGNGFALRLASSRRCACTCVCSAINRLSERLPPSPLHTACKRGLSAVGLCCSSVNLGFRPKYRTCGRGDGGRQRAAESTQPRWTSHIGQGRHRKGLLRPLSSRRFGAVITGTASGNVSSVVMCTVNRVLSRMPEPSIERQ